MYFYYGNKWTNIIVHISIRGDRDDKSKTII